MRQRTPFATRTLVVALLLVLSGCMDAPKSDSNEVADAIAEGGLARGVAGRAEGGTRGDDDDVAVPASMPDASRDSTPAGIESGKGGKTADDGVAAREDDVNRAIDNLLGDHAAYRDVFDRLQRGVAGVDKAGVAALVSYPIEVTIEGKSRKVRDAQEFIASWRGIFTPDIAKAISSQRFGDVFVNWQGVMLGDGQIWINGICRDVDCSESDVRVVTIQSVAK